MQKQLYQEGSTILLHLSKVLFYGEFNRKSKPKKKKNKKEAARNTLTLGGKPIKSSEILRTKSNVNIIHSQASVLCY